MLPLLTVAGVAHSEIIRVPSDQPTIQAGIDAAAVADVVLVASGVYAGNGNKDLDLRGKDLEVRSESGAEVTIIDCEGEGRGFYLGGFLSEAAIVDGFTIRNGNVEGDPRGGGAIFIAAAAPIIRNCNFERNRAQGLIQDGGGGAISIYNAQPTIANCRFIENSAIGSATIGGALAAHHSRIRVTDCVFERNVVTPTSGSGGGIGIVFAVSDTSGFIAEIQDCEFLNNEAGSGGGGAFLLRTRLDRCEFNGNRARSGGGFYDLGGSEITETNVVGNTASGFAGGLHTGGSILNRCMITDNSAPEGGGVRDSGGSMLRNCIISRNSATRGGGYAGVRRPSHFLNCTFADNEAPVASGAYLASGEYAIWLFERTVISGGLIGEAVRCDGTARAMLFCTDVFGNAGGDWVDCIMGQQSLAENMHVDPMFCQAGIDWHLCGDSPCAPPQTGACGLIGALPVGCADCGVQALELSTWGQIKHAMSRRRLRQVSMDGE